VQAIKENFFQREIAEASFRYQSEIEAKQRIVVGVNRYGLDDEQQLEILRIDPTLEGKQVGRVQAVRARRESAQVEDALVALKGAAAREEANLMPALLDAARVHATEGEIVEALQEVFGSYTETPVF